MNEVLIIKVTNEKDLEKCLEIRKKVFIEEQYVPEELEQDEFEDTSTHFLAYYENIPVGTGRFRIKDTFLKFERIATLLEYRNKKIGTLLMKKMEQEGLKTYPEFLQVAYAQKSALSFYQKLGWIPLGKIFMDAGIEHQMIIKVPKNEKDIINLKCLKDPKCPEEIKEYLMDITEKSI